MAHAIEERAALVQYARQRLSRQEAAYGPSLARRQHARAALDPQALTLGFARRFATYKRPALLLHDPGFGGPHPDHDAEALYGVPENEIIPDFYDRDEKGVRFGALNVTAQDGELAFEVDVYLGRLEPRWVRVELYAEPQGTMLAFKQEMQETPSCRPALPASPRIRGEAPRDSTRDRA